MGRRSAAMARCAPRPSSIAPGFWGPIGKRLGIDLGPTRGFTPPHEASVARGPRSGCGCIRCPRRPGPPVIAMRASRPTLPGGEDPDTKRCARRRAGGVPGFLEGRCAGRGGAIASARVSPHSVCHDQHDPGTGGRRPMGQTSAGPAVPPIAPMDPRPSPRSAACCRRSISRRRNVV
jgi:hypothetical protein